MKVGDLVRVTKSTGELLDTLEMKKLINERTPCLLIEVIVGGYWTCVLDKDVYRSIPTHRLEVVSDAK